MVFLIYAEMKIVENQALEISSAGKYWKRRRCQRLPMEVILQKVADIGSVGEKVPQLHNYQPEAHFCTNEVQNTHEDR
jgi:hypothetical protein